MSDYRIIHSDELYHYGVPGMKWGVRRYGEYTGPHKGIKKYRARKAQKVLTRLDEMKRDVKRMNRMNYNQKQSYNNAKAYWQQVEKSGQYKGGKIKRGVIKRSWDINRSMSFKERTARSVASSALTTAGSLYVQKKMNDKLGVKVDINKSEIGRKFIQDQLFRTAENEIVNKMFGHF